MPTPTTTPTHSWNIKPLKGQVLVRLLPPDYKTAGGIELPDTAQTNSPGGKTLPRKAVVVAVGPWRTTRSGLSCLPDFKPGETVLVSEYLGTKLTRNIGETLRLCRVDDVLAVIEQELTLR